MTTVRLVEVLFSDPRRADEAREALCAASIGDVAHQVRLIRDVSAYDHLASLGHSLAFPGVVLGAIGAGLRVSLVLLLAVLVLGLELELGALYLWAAAAFGYGALVGALVGSQLPAPGPCAMRRGIASGKAVVRVTTGDLASAMLAYELLVGASGAERALAD